MPCTGLVQDEGHQRAALGLVASLVHDGVIGGWKTQAITCICMACREQRPADVWPVLRLATGIQRDLTLLPAGFGCDELRLVAAGLALRPPSSKIRPFAGRNSNPTPNSPPNHLPPPKAPTSYHTASRPRDCRRIGTQTRRVAQGRRTQATSRTCCGSACGRYSADRWPTPVRPGPQPSSALNQQQPPCNQPLPTYADRERYPREREHHPMREQDGPKDGHEFASVAAPHFNASFNALSRDCASAARTAQWCSARQDELPRICMTPAPLKIDQSEYRQDTAGAKTERPGDVGEMLRIFALDRSSSIHLRIRGENSYRWWFPMTPNPNADSSQIVKFGKAIDVPPELVEMFKQGGEQKREAVSNILALRYPNTSTAHAAHTFSRSPAIHDWRDYADLSARFHYRHVQTLNSVANVEAEQCAPVQVEEVVNAIKDTVFVVNRIDSRFQQHLKNQTRSLSWRREMARLKRVEGEVVSRKRDSFEICPVILARVDFLQETKGTHLDRRLTVQRRLKISQSAENGEWERRSVASRMEDAWSSKLSQNQKTLRKGKKSYVLSISEVVSMLDMLMAPFARASRYVFLALETARPRMLMVTTVPMRKRPPPIAQRVRVEVGAKMEREVWDKVDIEQFDGGRSWSK
ncbi:hypothetical protein K438DRAFT_1747899 [Mycena galopus ATCC 62051]|nr:hypothetical protein K438DRAFT_1747899 [Mycena galopus ATCC 62051]